MLQPGNTIPKYLPQINENYHLDKDTEEYL